MLCLRGYASTGVDLYSCVEACFRGYTSTEGVSLGLNLHMDCLSYVSRRKLQGYTVEVMHLRSAYQRNSRVGACLQVPMYEGACLRG